MSTDSFAFLSPPDRPGDLGRLGPYRVVRLLGQGGMGVVFLAEDEALNRPVALKVMRPEVAAEPTARERFLREGRAAAAIKSDHVITIYQVSEANSVPYLAMEYLEGQNLEDWLKAWQQRRQGPVPAKVVIRVAKDMLRGLVAAHDKGLVHRDIKPANLWIEASTNRVKILDFGLTRGGGAVTELTQTGQVLGTVTYMAPEQARGQKVDGRADLFSAGVVLHRMLGGQSPFKRRTYNETIIALAVDEAPSAASFDVLPTELAGLVDRMLSKSPDRRPATAKAALAVVLSMEQRLRAEADERERAEAERIWKENERLRQKQADSDRAERMELWKRSGMPRTWVLKHLDGWGPDDWTALVSGLQSSPYWPLKADELGNYLEAVRDELRAEAVRDELRAERNRHREVERRQEAERQRQDAERKRQEEEAKRKAADVERKRQVEQPQQKVEEPRRLRQEHADRDRTERMALWKRSGIPRAWVLKHLDGWASDDLSALVAGLSLSRYWPLEVEEMVTYLETLREELKAERGRQREAELRRQDQREARKRRQTANAKLSTDDIEELSAQQIRNLLLKNMTNKKLRHRYLVIRTDELYIKDDKREKLAIYYQYIIILTVATVFFCGLGGVVGWLAGGMIQGAVIGVFAAIFLYIMLVLDTLDRSIGYRKQKCDEIGPIFLRDGSDSIQSLKQKYL